MADNWDYEWDDQAQRRVVSVMLREGKRFWIAAGAAGGSELPCSAEPYKLRVGLPVALAKALAWTPERAAELAADASSQMEEASGLRWLRWSSELPAGSFEALGLGSEPGQAALARRFEAAVGVPVFARFEVDALRGSGPGGDWASAARDPGDLVRLFSALEAKAIERVAPARGAGKGPSRI